MHFGDVDETNGGKTNSLRPRDMKRIDRAAANVQTGFFLLISQSLIAVTYMNNYF